jgi:hypothetical protein
MADQHTNISPQVGCQPLGSRYTNTSYSNKTSVVSFVLMLALVNTWTGKARLVARLTSKVIDSRLKIGLGVRRGG